VNNLDFVDPEATGITIDGNHEIETNIMAGQMLSAMGRLPEAQLETVLLVCWR
jgi:hypothetical protein